MNKSRLHTITLAALAGSVVSVANAQTSWTAPNNGTWSVIGNWTAGVPAIGVDATLGHASAYLVSAAGGNVRDLSVTNSLASLTVASGTTMNIAGNIVNNGTLTVNTTGGSSNANWSMNSPASSLTGTGTLVLNAISTANDANLTCVPDSNVLTQGAGHTISGAGQIYVTLINNGHVVADGVGKYIQFMLTPKTNNSLFVAQNGGVVDVENVTVTQSGGGTLRATGANSIVEAHGGIIGGTVEGVSGGLVRSGGNLALDGVDLNGTFNVMSGTSVNILSSLTNTGTITVNPTANATNANLSIDSPALTLDGGGTIILNGVGSSINDANLTASLITNVLTQSAGHTVTGSGQVYVSMINNGLIAADGAGEYLQLLQTPKTNNALFLAQNGATLDVEAISVNQSSGGILRATGTSSVVEAHGTIIGGTVEGVSGGLVRSGGNLVLDGVDLNGSFHVQSGTSVNILSSLTNTGTITVNPTANSTNANLSIDSPALTLDGGGTIVLNGLSSINDANLTASVVTNVLTQSAGHTVTGSGQVYVAMINNGLIAADGAGKYIQLLQTPKTNNALFVARNGATLDVEAITVDQTSGGTIRATGVGSIAEANGTILGGTVEGVKGGLVRSGGALLLDGVDLNGAFHIQSGHTVGILNSLTNTGTITVNPTAGSSDAVLSLNTPATSFDGTGTIMLNAASSIGDARLAVAAAGIVLTNNQGHTIAGSGQIPVTTINSGILSPGQVAPGDVTQRLDLVGAEADITCTPTSIVRINLEGTAAGQFDSITGGAGTSFACSGTLDVSHVGAFIGAPVGSTIDIIVAGSVTGTFSTVSTPVLPNNGRYVVVYLPDRVRLYATCYANCDSSMVNPVLTANDFQCFLNKFADSDPYANCDGSVGTLVLTANDFTCFLNRFANGCI